MPPADLLLFAARLEREADRSLARWLAAWPACLGRMHWKLRVAKLLRDMAENKE